MENFIIELGNLKAELKKAVLDFEKSITLAYVNKIKKAIDEISKSFSGSWLGYHANVYYKNFQIPPANHKFSNEWGLSTRAFSDGTVGPWIEYQYDEVIAEINENSDNSFLNINNFDECNNNIDKICKNCKQKVLSLLVTLSNKINDNYIEACKNDIEKIEMILQSDIIKSLAPKHTISRDSKAISQGYLTPPHISIFAKFVESEINKKNCNNLIEIIDNLQYHISFTLKAINNQNQNILLEEHKVMNSIKIFISHSSEDAEIIEGLIDVLQFSIEDLKDREIRCSSVESYNFKPGENFLEMIKDESGICDIILSAFSLDSLESKMVLFECGIGWYLNKLIPIIIDKEVEFNDIPLPCQNSITKKIFKSNELKELIEHIARQLSLKLNSLAKIDKKVNKFIKEFY